MWNFHPFPREAEDFPKNKGKFRGGRQTLHKLNQEDKQDSPAFASGRTLWTQPHANTADVKTTDTFRGRKKSAVAPGYTLQCLLHSHTLAFLPLSTSVTWPAGVTGCGVKAGLHHTHFKDVQKWHFSQPRRFCENPKRLSIHHEGMHNTEACYHGHVLCCSRLQSSLQRLQRFEISCSRSPSAFAFCHKMRLWRDLYGAKYKYKLMQLWLESLVCSLLSEEVCFPLWTSADFVAQGYFSVEPAGFWALHLHSSHSTLHDRSQSIHRLLIF